MISVIVNPRAGCVSEHGVDQVQTMIVAAVPEAHVVVLQLHDDIRSRTRDHRLHRYLIARGEGIGDFFVKIRERAPVPEQSGAHIVSTVLGLPGSGRR